MTEFGRWEDLRDSRTDVTPEMRAEARAELERELLGPDRCHCGAELVKNDAGKCTPCWFDECYLYGCSR